MIILRVSEHGLERCVSEAARALREGGLVVMPTDTVYGVAALPGAGSAESLLYECKGRAKSKRVALLASDIGAVESFGGMFSAEERRLAELYWPGPLTLVLGMRGARGEPGANEGFRVPACDVALALLRGVGGVLRVTSANRSGGPDSVTADAAVAEIAGFVDVVIDAGTAQGGRPSTVARVENGRITILRSGALDAELLKPPGSTM